MKKPELLHVRVDAELRAHLAASATARSDAAIAAGYGAVSASEVARRALELGLAIFDAETVDLRERVTLSHKVDAKGTPAAAGAGVRKTP